MRRTKYRYDFSNENELKDINYLIKLGVEKHRFGGGKTNLVKSHPKQHCGVVS